MSIGCFESIHEFQNRKHSRIKVDPYLSQIKNYSTTSKMSIFLNITTTVKLGYCEFGY
jgi:hypothetical protein